MADLNSDKALVCHSQHRCGDGVGTVWFVMLADGFLLDCNSERYSEARANTLAEIINAAGPEKLSREAMRANFPRAS
jgi:hypothetical protein